MFKSSILITLVCFSIASQANELKEANFKRLGSDFFLELTFNEDTENLPFEVKYSIGKVEVTFDKTTTSGITKWPKIQDRLFRKAAVTTDKEKVVSARFELNDSASEVGLRERTQIIKRANKLFIKLSDTKVVSSLPSVLPEKIIEAGLTADSGMDSGLGAVTENDGEIDDKDSRLSSEAAARAQISSEMGDGFIKTTSVPKEMEASSSKLAVGNTKNTSGGDDTPLFEDAAKPGAAPVFASSTNAIPNRVFLTIGILLILAGAAFYYVRRVYGFRKKSAKKNMIELLSQFYLGPKRSVALIRVAGETVLIGVTDQQVSLIKTLSLLDDDIPSTKMSKSFDKNLFSTVSAAAVDEDREEFSMKGIKEIVGERLKTFKEM